MYEGYVTPEMITRDSLLKRLATLQEEIDMAKGLIPWKEIESSQTYIEFRRILSILVRGD